MCQLTKDITESTDVAQAALTDPNILEKYGYQGAIAFDSTSVKFIEFFADKKIIKALEEGDAEQYLKLCKRNNFTFPDQPRPNLQFYASQIEKLDFARLGLSQKAQNYMKNVPLTRANETEFSPVAFFAVGVFYIGVAVNVLAVENMYYFHYYTSTKYAGVADSNSAKSFTNIDLAKTYKATNADMVYDIRDIEIDEAVKQLKIVMPEISKNMTDDDIKILMESALDGLNDA
ncbi:hypothetical protein [uncultured Bacteroides sp.]|uniref:hypothetical protein n=1 Tax=uncultured Bacteroides sp. TaxID=162156 RepID=UPI002AAC10F4|nr:hypothetical protein [uncultured Bacteroides sp.]